MTQITNFGGNVRFNPREYYRPRAESELLEILKRHRRGTIRVVASKHAWSEAIVSPDALVDMEHFRDVTVREENGQSIATVGAGCQVKHLLAALNKRDLTLPSVGLITEQTIAGATATGTHGTGKHCLSHYLESVRIACYRGGKPTIVDVKEGDELRAARCSLGCLGIVISVDLPCVPQYRVLESPRFCDTIEGALESEASQPIQQFYLMPHSWRYIVQQRHPTARSRSWSAPLYAIYWFLMIDIAMHLGIKLTACWLRSRALSSFLFRRIIPSFIFPWWKVVDRSDRILTMEHELFRHLELEAFVTKDQIVEATRFVETVMKRCNGDDEQLASHEADVLREHALYEEFIALRGTFSHHYPVCFRRILRDDTLISMAAGDADWWYSISFITYLRPRDDFFRMATFLARAMLALYGARIHWGKWFPLSQEEVRQQYPNLERFREICRKFDPDGVFQNDFTTSVLGLA